MGKLGAFVRISTGDRVRLLTAAVLLPVVRVALAVISFARLRAGLVRVADSTASFIPGSPRPERIAWAVDAADRTVPGDRTCLVRSLTTEALLRAYGHDPVHRIGVDRSEDGAVEAHSWIEYDGDVLIGQLDDLARYEPLPPLAGGDQP
ncbi:lasso peptide biosynthesis B2 protein [Halorientalis pallida]|uniref:lasso peptide biosynthesis B2 protein n=1 Tax=Halorientalis pallida TaxID=2479928 RepID=UPI003C6EB747